MSTSEEPLLGAPPADGVNRVSVDQRFFHASTSASIATGDQHPAPARATFFDEHERYPQDASWSSVSVLRPIRLI